MLSYIFIAVYLIFLLVFANLSGAEDKGGDFALAGRKMKTLPVFVSILATETSAASLLLFPDLGFSPSQRFIFLQLAAGMVIGRILSAYLLIGPIYNSNKSSVYEILAEKFSGTFSKLAAFLYTIATMLAAGVRLFIGAIALSILLSGKNDYMQISLFIVLAGGIAVYYSQKGGLRSVIYTDNVQFLLILGALFAVLALNFDNMNLGKLRLDNFIQTALPEDTPWYNYTYSLPLAFIGGIVLSLGSHSIDQTTVQRVLAQRSAKEAKKSVLYSAIVIGPFIFLYLLCGYAISQGAPDNFDKTQYIYPWYLYEAGNSWLSALTCLAFLSAAMSSIDSALHSIATSVKQTEAKLITNLSLRSLTLLSGFCLIISALAFQYIKWVNPNALLVSLALGATGMVFSPMAALYLMMYYYPEPRDLPSTLSEARSLNSKPAYISLCAGVICNLFIFGLNNLIDGVKISWLLSLVISFALTSLTYAYALYIYGRLFKSHQGRPVTRNTMLIHNENELLLYLESGTGISGYRLTRLKEEASARDYYRLHLPGEWFSVNTMAKDHPLYNLVKDNFTGDGKKKTCVISVNHKSIDAFDDFSAVQKEFQKHNIPVPRIYGIDHDQGLIWLEDLGDDDLMKLNEQSQAGSRNNHKHGIDENIEKYYTKTIECLALFKQVQPAPPGNNRYFDYEKLFSELIYLGDNVSRCNVKLNIFRPPGDTVINEWKTLCRDLDSYKNERICHRDFHCANILIKDKSIYLIDFQDARMGSRYYDLTSLLYDPYADLDESFREKLYEYYHHLTNEPDDRAAFEKQAIQRLLKALGTYVHQTFEKKKTKYAKYIPPARRDLSALLAKNNMNHNLEWINYLLIDNANVKQ